MTTTISAKDLTKLIKTCKLNAVSELEFGEVKIKFQTGDAVKLPVSGDTVRPPSSQELEQAQEDAQIEMNLSDADDELAFMQVENPVLFEQLLVENDLVEVEGDTESDGEGHT